MAWIVDQLLAKALGYSLLETEHLSQGSGNSVRWIHETELGNRQPGEPPSLPGRKDAKGSPKIFFRKNAYRLGLIAKTLSKTQNDDVIAILFRDKDGTHKTSRTEWSDKVQSIENGFQLAEYDSGIPMVPRPKSEAWILAALKYDYRDCEHLEDAPGNDGSPNSLKIELDTYLGHSPSAQEQADWVQNGQVDICRLNLASYQAFVSKLESTLQNLSLLPQGQKLCL